jgi:hypothetical protein
MRRNAPPVFAVGSSSRVSKVNVGCPVRKAGSVLSGAELRRSSAGPRRGARICSDHCGHRMQLTDPGWRNRRRGRAQSGQPSTHSGTCDLPFRTRVSAGRSEMFLRAFLLARSGEAGMRDFGPMRRGGLMLGSSGARGGCQRCRRVAVCRGPCRRGSRQGLQTRTQTAHRLETKHKCSAIWRVFRECTP